MLWFKVFRRKKVPAFLKEQYRKHCHVLVIYPVKDSRLPLFAYVVFLDNLTNDVTCILNEVREGKYAFVREGHSMYASYVMHHLRTRFYFSESDLKEPVLKGQLELMPILMNE